jgi:hypothetical protein
MSVIKFIKSLFAKRDEHVQSVKQIEKQIAEVLDKVEPQKAIEKPKKPKAKAKKKPVKKKTHEPK